VGQRADEMNRDAIAHAAGEAAEVGNSDDTAEIRADIEQTRSQMGETIDAIQARLNPQHIGEQVKEQVREQIHEVTSTVREATIGRAEQMVRNAGESVNDARYGLMETIRANPIPAAMAAIGLGWLFMNRRSAPPRRYYDERSMRRGERYYAGEAAYPYRPAAPYAYTQGGYDFDYDQARERDRNLAERAQHAAGGAVNKAQETVGNVADQARDAAGNVVGQARDAAGNLIDQARGTAGSLAGQAQYQARRVENTFESALGDNPLGLGALALALGAAVGFGLPQTERENQLMGEARESLVEKAQEVAQDTVEKAQRVAGDVAETAQQTAKQGAREQGLMGEKR
jgi:ElaB/YqjD/DUF883 family membrane-anchored ribosome-binding protein